MIDVIFIGAANPETIRMISAVKRSINNFNPIGFLDNDPQKANTSFFGFPVFGALDYAVNFDLEKTFFINLITGSTEARYSTTKQLLNLGCKFINFIHPSVDLTMVSIGTGNYIQENVVVQAGVQILDNSSIHTGAIVGHETTIGSHTFIAHAVSVSGCCRIGNGVFIGTNATILPRITIGDGATIGAGAVILKDVPANAIMVGNPGKILKIKERRIDE